MKIEAGNWNTYFKHSTYATKLLLVLFLKTDLKLTYKFITSMYGNITAAYV